jgi:hypothetical protein
MNPIRNTSQRIFRTQGLSVRYVADDRSPTRGWQREMSGGETRPAPGER